YKTKAFSKPPKKQTFQFSHPSSSSLFFLCFSENRASPEKMKYIRTNSLKRLFSLIRRTLEEQQQHNLTIGPPVLTNLDSPPAKPTWKCFSYDEIALATDSFNPRNIVGRGGYAEVYRGILPGTGELVAVKRLTKSCTDERKEKEFLMEIGTIGHVNHPNVLPLVGCCIDGGLYLIFRYSSVGSLASLLHGENWKVLDWGRRYKIAIGTAKGINYLHKGCQRRIIHRDIKSSNVLLTEDYEPLVLMVMVDEGEMGKERWKMGEDEEEQQDEFWGFEDLECDTCSMSPPSSSSINNDSPQNSFSMSSIITTTCTPTPTPS
ncbi:Receptor-like cytosolic serine/threonine-protein kinase RBK2, partial [Linum grandiflorum]